MQDSAGSKNSKANGANNDEEPVLLRANSVPVLNQQEEREQRQHGPTATPLSAPGKAFSHTKMKSKTRTRLMNKFNAMTVDSESMKPKNTMNGVQGSSAQIETVVKGPWASIGHGYV